MANKTIVIIVTALALIAIGAGAGYYVANHDVTDDSSGYSSSDVDKILQKYADDLNAKGGVIAFGEGGKHTVKAGDNIEVENGGLVFDYHNSPLNVTYYVPFHSINYVYVNI